MDSSEPRDTREWRRPWTDDEPIAGVAAAVAPAEAPTPGVRPASPMPPPAAWGDADAGPGSPFGSVRPPDTTGTVDAPRPVRRGRGFVTGMVGALLGAVIGTATTLAVFGPTDASPTTVVTPTSGPAVQAPLVEVPEGSGAGVVAAVAAAVTPSVVRIDVLVEETQDEVGVVNVPAGVGSGVIYRSDGYILTNNHVVEGADVIRVQFSDGERAAAELVGADAFTDLAVLRVDRTGLPAINLRGEESLTVGETAIAIGSPFGLDASVTAGVVSAVNRDLQVPPRNGRPGVVIPAVIQTDAAINPGNSGGALVDSSGRLIGINTAILTGTGGSQGVGFAIPTTSAVAAADQLIEDGFVTHPFLGVSGFDVTRELAARWEQQYDQPLAGGAVIEEVVPGSGSDAAGLQREDIIIAVDDREIEDFTELVVAIRAYAPGDEVTLTVLREGERLTLDVELGERPR